MKNFLLLFLIFPFFVFAQRQQTASAPTSGTTDCPTFNKKNTFSKAAMFQQMRTRKPQKTQEPIYRTDAPAIVKSTNQSDETPTSPVENKTVKIQKRVKKTSSAQPQEDAELARSVPKTEETSSKTEVPLTEKETSINSESDATEAVSEVHENKKVKKKLFKNRSTHRVKKYNKRTARRKAAKCPQF